MTQVRPDDAIASPPASGNAAVGPRDMVLRIGGTAASGAIGGAALGSLGGPVGTMIGSIVGTIAGLAVSTVNVYADRAGKK